MSNPPEDESRFTWPESAGMTVVMVVHQPRYSLFTLFDDLLLLGLGGRTVYLGKSEGALPYFGLLDCSFNQRPPWLTTPSPDRLKGVSTFLA